MKSAVETDVLQRGREEAARRFEELGWPTTRLEAWKYTSLSALSKLQWNAADRDAASQPTPDLQGQSLQSRALTELVFLNGVLSTQASTFGDSPGVRVTSLRDADPALLEKHLGRYADAEKHAMTALNAANATDGAVVEVTTPVDGFVHLLFVGTDGFASHVRNLVVAGRGAQIAVVETYIGTGRYFTNVVTEIAAGEGAVVDHYKVGCESVEAFHIGTVQIHQERASNTTARTISIGGALVRNETNAILDGEGAAIVLDGLYIGSGTQHIDNHTVIEHAKPHCDSLELYKGVLDEKARGIFDGSIIVHKDAQKTTSRQTNNNLLLSESAIADSKPTLEIFNDDVKCNHGSTIGQLEEEPLFYLRSRGIGEDEARNLLVHAFASEIVDRMKIEPVREQIRRAMFQAMPDRLPERRGPNR